MHRFMTSLKRTAILVNPRLTHRIRIENKHEMKNILSSAKKNYHNFINLLEIHQFVKNSSLFSTENCGDFQQNVAAERRYDSIQLFSP